MARPDIRADAPLAIAGVEYTQSTQYNSSAGGGYGPDNGVSLVAYKTMAVRAYPIVRRGMLSDTLTGQRVTGQLSLSIGDRVIYSSGPTRIDGARVGPASSLHRGTWDQEFTIFGGGPSSVSIHF